MSSTEILLVDDEPAICEVVCLMLSDQGYQVDYALNANHALKKIRKRIPDILLVDWMLPGMSGVELVRYLHNVPETKDLPIIMLTAKATEEDKIKGLDYGCDDYITKPFSKNELNARIKALLRRVTPHKELKKLSYGPFELNPIEHQFLVNGEELSISATEFRLLHFFMANHNKVLSRRRILDNVWGRDKFIEERTVDVHMRRLRNILSAHNVDQSIQTVRGVGYRFCTQIEK